MKILLIVISIFCLLLLLLLFGILLPYKDDIIRFIKRKINKRDINNYGSLDLAVEQSFELANKKQGLIRGKIGLIEDLKNFYITDRINLNTIELNYHQSFLLAGIAYYSEYTGKNRDIVIRLVDKYITSNGSLKNRLKIVDEVPFGLACVSLFRQTDELRYKKVCDEIYDFCLKKQTEKDGILYRDNADWNYPDSLAMTVPFLMEYGTTFKDAKAVSIAENNLRIYYRYGVDKETGIPCHAYSIVNKIKLGSMNWGRGIGWYLLAASYVPSFVDLDLNKSIEKMEYTQFVGGSLDDTFDSTTALLFEFYKKEKMGLSNGLDFIKPYIDSTGIITNVSGDTFWMNSYANRFGSNKLGNALFMMMLSRYLKPA